MTICANTHNVSDMKNSTIKADDILEMIRKDAAKTSQLDVANRIGVSPSYLGEMLKGTRAVSEKVALYYLPGYKKEIVFVRAS